MKAPSSVGIRLCWIGRGHGVAASGAGVGGGVWGVGVNALCLTGCWHLRRKFSLLNQ